MEKDKPFYYGATPRIFNNASALRKNMTDAEDFLWKYLRGRKLDGFKFRRQHPIGRFIADFYCHDSKLVVEVDGGIHNDKEQMEYDEDRTSLMKEMELTVIRFTNEEVKYDLENVLKRIRENLTSPSTPSPKGDGA